MPFGNPGGYRKRAPQRRGGGGNAALVNALQQVLQRFRGGGRGGSTTSGRLGKGARAMARTRGQRVGDNVGFRFDDDSEGNYADTGRGGVRIGYRK